MENAAKSQYKERAKRKSLQEREREREREREKEREGERGEHDDRAMRKAYELKKIRREETLKR